MSTHFKFPATGIFSLDVPTLISIHSTATERWFVMKQFICKDSLSNCPTCGTSVAPSMVYVLLSHLKSAKISVIWQICLQTFIAATEQPHYVVINEEQMFISHLSLYLMLMAVSIFFIILSSALPAISREHCVYIFMYFWSVVLAFRNYSLLIIDHRHGNCSCTSLKWCKVLKKKQSSTSV